MSLGTYIGQRRKLRELAISKLGVDKVSTMADDEVSKLVEDEYSIFWGDITDDFDTHSPDNEVIALIPSDVFRELRNNANIVFIER